MVWRVGYVEYGRFLVERRGAARPRLESNRQGGLEIVSSNRRVPRRKLQAQMVAGEVVQIVQGMLGQSDEVLRFLLLQGVCLYRDLEGKDRSTGLLTM